MTPTLQALQIKEAEATGHLTAVIFGMLINYEHNLAITHEQWLKLREAYDDREAAFKATTNLLCGKLEAVDGRPL